MRATLKRPVLNLMKSQRRFPLYRYEGSVLVFLFAILFLTNLSFAEEAIPQKILTDLSSAEFKVRVDAQQQLLAIAQQSPEQLGEIAINATPEVLLRILKSLELVFLQNENVLGDRAEQVLMLIADEPAPTGVLAHKILLNHARLRESRAREAFEALGGEFAYVNPLRANSRDMIYRSLAVAPGTGAGFGPPAILQTVWLHEDWSGKPADLWHIRRLIHCSDIALYSIKGNGMDLEDLYRLAAVIPGLAVAERGPCLGIRSAPFSNYGCEIDDVLPRSSAFTAGLQRGDQIFELNGDQIRSFSHLVESLQVFSIGEVVELSLYRGLERMVIPVTLGSWRGIAFGSPEYASAPPHFGGPLGKIRLSKFPPPVPLPERVIFAPL